ncbi:myosin essential light chain, striated adductor muscle-like [Babylonia areolata]|uniref:myosin essential light chain, striated adductor muscle-like n=1 Tax=Babylonia areolata TaxID=304850 RepID=UPI003FD49EA5
MSSPEELAEVQEVFDLFDFWDGRDGLIDAAKVGDLLRCMGLNPTLSTVHSAGGTSKPGEKQLSLDQFLAIYRQMGQVKEWGTFRDFEEAFKSFDREGQGFISAAECRHLLTSMGERLTDEDVDRIMELTEVEVDLEGNIKYADFISKIMAGPSDADK